METLWSACDLVQCLTLTTRPDRRRAAADQFAAVGLGERVVFLEQTPDEEDGKRGCFHAHQQAAREAMRLGARRALIFEDDVEFLPQLTPQTATRAARFLRRDADASCAWDIFFLGHFPRKMALTADADIVRVRSMDAHAYVLSPEGARALSSLTYAGDQIDVHFHYHCERAFALYPMLAVQTPGPSDTEGLVRPSDWNDDKLRRERELYEACVRRKALATALGTAAGDVLQLGVLASSAAPKAPIQSSEATGRSAPEGHARPDEPAIHGESGTGAGALTDDTFDWVLDWAQVEPHVSPNALGIAMSSRVVDVGCGYSTTPVHLSSIYADVLALDREQSCVDAMAAKHERSRGLRWAACDVCSIDALAQIMPKGSANLVFDKGTLDCAIVEDDAARLLACVDWMLADQAVYAVVSFRKPELLLPLLSCSAIGWKVSHEYIRIPGRSEPASCCIVRKNRPGAVCEAVTSDAVNALLCHTQEVLDRWYTQENPLLTPGREEELRTIWARTVSEQEARDEARSDALPIDVAYRIMLTPRERTEITFEEFTCDVLPFLSNNKDAHVSSIKLDEALAYLKEEQ